MRPTRWRLRPRRRCARAPAGRHTSPIIRLHAVDLLERGGDGRVALQGARHEDRPELRPERRPRRGGEVGLGRRDAAGEVERSKS